MEIVEFVRAQLDIDQRVAGGAESLAKWNAVHGASEQDPSGVYMYMGYMYLDYRVFEGRRGDVEHAARWDPPRVLREVEAKRARVSLHLPLTEGSGCPTCWEGVEDGGPEPFPCRALRLEALPYAGQEGFREEWHVDG